MPHDYNPINIKRQKVTKMTSRKRSIPRKEYIHRSIRAWQWSRTQLTSRQKSLAPKGRHLGECSQPCAINPILPGRQCFLGGFHLEGLAISVNTALEGYLLNENRLCAGLSRTYLHGVPPRIALDSICTGSSTHLLPQFVFNHHFRYQAGVAICTLQKQGT
jgi:hypothetical protein